MRRFVFFWTIFAAVCSFVAASPEKLESAILDTGFHLKIDADWVYVNASVRDPHNRSNSIGLGKEDFLVYEDGVPQNVGSCVPGETPFNLLLLMDVSASTAPFNQLLKESAMAFARQLSPADRIAIMTFSSRPRLILSPTNDRAKLKSALRLVRPDGATSFYDALMAAFGFFEDVKGRKAIVVFSDGVDNQLVNPKDGSVTRFPQLVNVARQSDCLVYSVFLPPAPEEAAQPAVLKAQEQMQTLAAETGGRLYALREAKQLPGQFSEIAQDLRFIYTLAYAPDRSAPAGWRTLKVEVKGHPELSVHARTGYLSRKRESEQSARTE